MDLRKGRIRRDGPKFLLDMSHNNNKNRGMHIRYWWESQKERDHKEDQEVGMVWTSGGLL
jgi:hypothetical protein